MFLGLRTVVYEVDDLDKAKQWYSQVLGHGPYFDEPFYVGFNVAGFELGLHPGEIDGDERVADVEKEGFDPVERNRPDDCPSFGRREARSSPAGESVSLGQALPADSGFAPAGRPWTGSAASFIFRRSEDSCSRS